MNTQCLKIDLRDGSSYRIYVGEGLLAGIGEQVAQLVKGKKACIITDSVVGPLYLSLIHESLKQAGFTVFDLVIPAGEQSKDINVAQELWLACAEQGLGRDGVICALGGGVVGDLAGFVASTYMRGVPCVQIPTSLLAMVDSSIGGKTGINLQAGKNIIGTFAQPVLVAIDLAVLETLPASEWDNGFAEIAKSALVDGDDFYTWLVEHVKDLRNQEKAVVQEAIVRSLAFKGRVVAADERESGMRECLNYGHTFGHALEAVAGYGAISHGKAVAAGMRFAAQLAREAVDAPPKIAKKQNALLDALGLPDLQEVYPVDELFDRIRADKKVRDNEARFVFVTAPGKWQTVAVNLDLLKIHLILWAEARM